MHWSTGVQEESQRGTKGRSLIYFFIQPKITHMLMKIRALFCEKSNNISVKNDDILDDILYNIFIFLNFVSSNSYCIMKNVPISATELQFY